MKKGFRQSMAWLHLWVGLLPGWLLFVIFLFGSGAFFQHEISRWMRPELSHNAVTIEAVNAASDYLVKVAPDAASWNISLPTLRGGEPLEVSWEPREGSALLPGEAALDPATGRELAIRDTRAGYFIYRFHFDLHYMPVWLARYLVSIAALAMLVAILSGIVTHKKIFADFFMLRFRKGQRSWLDAHNITAVLALPFHLMITYTGLVTLLFTLMPWAISTNFADEDAYFSVAFPSPPEHEGEFAHAHMLPMGLLLNHTGMAKNNNFPSYISITDPGTNNAIAAVWPRYDQLGTAKGALYVSATTGEIVQKPQVRGGATATKGVMIDLHTGRFSDFALRWLYFLSGLAGTAMIATGLVLWTVKRRAKLPEPDRPHFGFRLVERLNIGVIAGSCAGMAAYFLANRLLPLELTNRADWEINSLFIVWGGIFTWSLARPTKRAWVEALAVSAALYALVPVVNALTTTRGLTHSLIAQDWVFVGFDLTMLAIATACAFTSRTIANHTPKTASRRMARTLVEATT